MPEINGIVLDAVTREPIKEGWVMASIGINVRTVAGDVGQVVEVAPAHLRTDGAGRFRIPSKVIEIPPFPVTFGREVENLIITVWTLDQRGVIKLGVDRLKGRRVEVVIYAEDVEELMNRKLADLPVEKREMERLRSEFSSLQSLYEYCETGRFGIEVPAVDGGCDEWELNYAIKRHERFLAKYKGPKTRDQKLYYSAIKSQLGYLLRKKGDYLSALRIFQELKEFDEERKVKLWLRDYERQIKELKELLGEQK